MFLSMGGSFNENHTLVLYDVMDRGVAFACIKKATSAKSGGVVNYTNTMLIKGVEYTYKTTTPLNVRGICKVYMSGTAIAGVSSVGLTLSETSTSLQAMDSRRIKIKDRVYKLKNDVGFYLKDNSGNITVLDQKNIVSNYGYSSILVYTDTTDNKVVGIVLSY